MTKAGESEWICSVISKTIYVFIRNFIKKFMIILVATCGIYGKIRVRTLLITERAVEF